MCVLGCTSYIRMSMYECMSFEKTGWPFRFRFPLSSFALTPALRDFEVRGRNLRAADAHMLVVALDHHVLALQVKAVLCGALRARAFLRAAEERHCKRCNLPLDTAADEHCR
jgi:hypothetical protein